MWDFSTFGTAKFCEPPISAATEASNLKFVIQLVFGGGRGIACQNNFLYQNYRGSGLGEHLENFGTPFLFLQQF